MHRPYLTLLWALTVVAGCHRTISIGDDPRGCRPDAGVPDGDVGPPPPSLIIDLATDPVGRTFLEPATNRQLSTVAIGDVTGDGVVEIVLADASDPGTRIGAGTVHAYPGAGALDGSRTELPAGSTLRVLGASENDRLGTAASGGGVLVADVTGDALPDLVVAAPLAGADGGGSGEPRAEAGEVYVLAGGPGLSGDVDLAAAPSALRSTIFGAAAGDRLMLLALGDLTGDGVADLVLGAPWSDAGGADSGAAYVVAGGAALPSAIDLAAPPPSVRLIRGPGEGARLGTAAAVGGLLGGPEADLLIGDEIYSDELRVRGAVFAFEGPIAGDRDAGGAVGSAAGPSVRWIGAGANDHLGRAIAIGNVVGDARADVVLGAYQQRCARAQLGALNVWDGASLISGTTITLADGGGRTAVLYGAAANDSAGISLALGDLDADGYLDIPVASGLADGPGDARDGAGEVVFFLGGPSIAGTIDLSTDRGRIHVYGAAARDALGLDPAGIALGDLTGDGRADVCLGSFGGGVAQGGRVDCFASPL